MELLADSSVQRSLGEFVPPKDANTNIARELLQALRRHEGRVLLLDAQSGRQWTGASLLDFAGRLASGLAERARLKPNDVVMTICDHSDREIAMALGVVLAGGALFGTTPSDGLAEVETLCNIVRPDVFVVSSKYHARALQLRRQVRGLHEAKIVWLDAGPCGGVERSPAPRHNGDGESAPKPPGHDEPEQLAAATIQRDQVLLVDRLMEEAANWPLVESIVYERIKPREHILTYMLTSGSTGRPKVVPSTHAELVEGLFSMISASRSGLHLQTNQVDANNNGPACEAAPRELAPLMPCHADQVIAGDLPLDHGAGLNTMFLSLWLGAKFVVIPSYEVDSFWQAVSDHGITFSISSTTLCYRLFARLKTLIDSGDTKRWNLSSFKYICCCGAKLAFVDLVKEVQRHYNQMTVAQAYGCTEIGFISMLHTDDCRTHLHSTGYLFPGLLAKVVEPANLKRLCAPNERGELLVWARSKFKGYRCHPDDKPAQIYANCHDERGLFYKTGDQAHFDPQGRLYIHGRFKDTLVLMEDWKILPAELEELINEHPLVEMSVVVGVPDPELPGCHAPRAFVKLVAPGSPELRRLSPADNGELAARFAANDTEFLAKHIYDFVASRTARPKHLTGGVRLIDEFPRVGLLNKVDRKALKLMD